MYFNLLRPVNVSGVFTVLAIVAVLAIVFALLIVLVSKLCAVKVDEKAEAIQEHLAGANCGGCGYAGCADFAKALSEGKASLTACGPTSNQEKAQIAKILDIPFSADEPVCAVVHCAGGHKALDKYNYVGNHGCIEQNALLGGKKACSTGCIGEGSCLERCSNNAIKIVDGVATVVPELCFSCKVCVNVCPKKIISMVPKKSKVYIACSSNCKGKDVMSVCKVGCIGCGLCAKNCPEGAIVMENNVAVIDYSKCTGCKTCMAKCPRKIIREF